MASKKGWQNETSTTTIHYRYKLTPTVENMTMGTTTISLSGINGITAGEITNVKLFEDMDGNGTTTTSSWGSSGTTTPGVIVYTYDYSGDAAQSIAIDSSNSIYAAGYYTNEATADNDWMVRKYDSNGKTYDGVSSRNSQMPGNGAAYNATTTISGGGGTGTGTITFATSTSYLISTTTDFLVELTVNPINEGDYMTMD